MMTCVESLILINLSIHGPALQIWQGKEENVPAAREEFKKRLELNHLADKAEYNIDLEFAY